MILPDSGFPSDFRDFTTFAAGSKGFLHIPQPETNEFANAVEAYVKVAEKKSRKKQVLIFST
jgi:hypothetical protein